MQSLPPEQIIVSLIERYTLVVERCFPVLGRQQTMSAIDRLLRDRQISQWRHSSGLRYWTARTPRPLADQSLIRSLGVLLFCHESKSRSLLTRTEFAACFPNLWRHGLPAGHYVDRSPQSMRLGLVRVDAGHSKINRIVSRTVRLADKYRQQTGFRNLIDNGQFELTWIVPTAAKQRRLVEALQPLAGSGIRSQVCALPELLNVIAPIAPG